jgi:hypothetical protein
MEQILFWLFMIYDAVVVLPYFWVKVAFGIAAGLLIPNWIVGLVACAAGNAALFFFTQKQGTALPAQLMAVLVWSIFAFAGVVWWVVGRVLRWGFYKIVRAAR